MPPPSGRIAKIQYLRALAAFSVLLYHAAYYVELARGGTALGAVFGHELGLFGVTLFFVISGYLMATLSPGAKPFSFLLHRIIRIYPVYWLVVAMVLLLRHLAGEGVQLDPGALGLIPGDGRIYVLGVEWTLPFELSFYVVLTLCILLGLNRWLNSVAVIWLVLILLARFAWPEMAQRNAVTLLPPISHLLLSERTASFVLGLLIPAALGRVRFGPEAWILGIGLCFASLAKPEATILTMAVGCALMVAAAASERDRQPGLDSIVLLRLGDWSFALYLVHVPVVLWMLSVLPASVTPVHAWMAVSGAALAVSVAVGRLDVGLYRVLKRFCNAWPSKVVTATGLAFLTAFLGSAVLSEWSERQAWGAQHDAADLGRRVAEARQAGTGSPGTEAVLQSMGLQRNPALTGHLDRFATVSAGRVRYQGWALDRVGRRQTMVLLFTEDGLLDSLVPQLARPDVLSVLGLQGDSHVGFTRDLPTDACRPGLRLEGVVVAGLHFAPLQIPPGAVRCPGP